MTEDRGTVLLKRVGLVVGLAAFLAIAFIPSGLHQIEGAGRRPAYAAATAALMAVWWFTEAIPMHWTACAPILLFPLFGVFGPGPLRNAGKALESFGDAYLFLFLGGMMIGAAGEAWNLHRRVALHIMRAIGTGPRRLLLGVLVATAFVSLWISNTATAVMMMPIGMALLAQLEAASGGRKLWNFGAAVMLGVAYAANVGGIGTKIGTGPNSIFCGWTQKHLGLELSFPFYMALAFPFVVLFLPVAWAALWRLARRDAPDTASGRAVLDRALASLGPMARNEKIVLAVFLAAAGLWMTGGALRGEVAKLIPEIWPGFKLEGKHYEAWVAMAAGTSLLAAGILPFRAMRRLPWSSLILMGGGFAMASGIEGSGLSRWLALQLGAVAALPALLQVGLATLVTVALTAFASNVASVTVMLQVLPRSMPILMASTIATSCDFMLPAGTPPNAIVFGSGYIRLPVMMRTGFLLDLAAAALLTLYAHFYLRHLLA